MTVLLSNKEGKMAESWEESVNKTTFRSTLTLAYSGFKREAALKRLTLIHTTANRFESVV